MKNKICFAHNVYNAFDDLKKTINNNRKYFPESKVIISSNYDKNINLEIDNSEIFKFGINQGHKLGALNGMLSAMNRSIHEDCDLIVFSHGDVYINDINLFNKCLEMINNNFDFIGRRYIGDSKNGDRYFMFDCFIIKKQLAIKCFNKIKLIEDIYSLPRDYRTGPCPELFFGNIICNNTEKFHVMDYSHTTWYDNELGFYHIPSNDTEYNLRWLKN